MQNAIVSRSPCTFLLPFFFLLSSLTHPIYLRSLPRLSSLSLLSLFSSLSLSLSFSLCIFVPITRFVLSHPSSIILSLLLYNISPFPKSYLSVFYFQFLPTSIYISPLFFLAIPFLRYLSIILPFSNIFVVL